MEHKDKPVRRLLILPEIHTRHRLAEAVRKAKSFNDTKVKLFLEGITPSNQKSFSDHLKYSLIPIEDADIQKISAILAFSHTISKTFSWSWLLQNLKAPESAAYFHKLQIGLAVYNLRHQKLNKSNPPLDSIVDLFEINLIHIIRLVKQLELADDNDIAEILALMDRDFTNQLSAFRSLINRMIIKGNIDLAKLAELRKYLHTYFEIIYSFNMGLKISGLDLSLKFITPYDKELTPLAFEDSIYLVCQQYYILREAYIAYCISKERFQTGVLNIGVGHVSTEGLMVKLLASTGMQLVAIKERMPDPPDL